MSTVEKLAHTSTMLSCIATVISTIVPSFILPGRPARMGCIVVSALLIDCAMRLSIAAFIVMIAKVAKVNNER